jgi:hypothetical protein
MQISDMKVKTGATKRQDSQQKHYSQVGSGKIRHFEPTFAVPECSGYPASISPNNNLWTPTAEFTHHQKLVNSEK